MGDELDKLINLDIGLTDEVVNKERSKPMGIAYFFVHVFKYPHQDSWHGQGCIGPIIRDKF